MMQLSDAFAAYFADTDNKDNYEIFGEALLEYVKRSTTQLYKGQAQPNELEDIAGNSIIRVLENLKSYKGDAKFHNWVTAIIFNEGQRLISKEAARQEQAYTGTENYNPGPSMNDRIALEQIVTKLNPPERVLVRLKMEGLEEVEIAEELDIPLGTVKSRWNTLRDKMRTLSGVA